MRYKKRAYYKAYNGYIPATSEEICSLGSEDEQRIFIDSKKPFYLEPADDGPKLTFNTYQKTFRYYGEYEGRCFGSSEESVTHLYCIEQLAKLKEFTIIAKNNFANIKKGEFVTFKYNFAFPEIVLPLGNHYIKPDLLLYFREPYDLALRWNRLLAI